MKSKTNTLNTNPLPILVIGLVLIAIIQLVILSRLSQQQNNDEAILKNQAMQGLRQVQDEFGPQQPIIDSAAKRLYLPGLNMFLPLNLDTMDVNYRVTDANGGGTTDLVFSSKQNNNSYTALRDSSNECLDLVRAEVGAAVSQPRPGETAQLPIKLADGRQVYLYLPQTDPNCQQYQLVPPNTVLESVKQLQSY